MQLEAADASIIQQSPTTRQPRPLLDPEFNHLMRAVGPFETRPALAVAVSGGPDSLALTILASRWATSFDGHVIGLTVDHGLRDESTEEARQTGRWLSRYGIEHHVLTWSGAKPTSGIQQEARKTRYELLFAWCRDAGILHLLTGHHLQDQAETVALRQARQSGPRGLSGMAAVREVQGLRLLRPLLAIDKARLQATLRHFGQAWIDDPSNRSLSYRRNRLRHEGIDHANLTDQASRHGLDRQTLDKNRHVALVRSVKLHPAGFAHVCAREASTWPLDQLEELLASLLITIGGAIYPPRRRGLRRLIDAMQRDQPFPGRTLGHCLIIRQKEHWFFCRESGSASTLTLISGQWHHWDGRFMIRCFHQLRGLTVRELGERGWSRREHLIDHQQVYKIPPAARPSLPSVWQDNRLLAIPHAGLFDRDFKPLDLELGYRPSIPLGNAPFAAHMCACSNEKIVAAAQC